MLNKQEQLNIVKSNSGFSLVEAIVALLVLSIIIIPLLNIFVFSARTNTRLSQQQEANIVASNIMEEIKAQGITQWADNKNWDFSEGPLKFTESGGTLNFNVEVSSEPSSHSTGAGILWNNYQMQDLSKMDKATTAVINPFELFVAYEGTGNNQTVKLTDTYDDMAAAEFRNKHLEEIYEHWSDYVSGLDEGEEEPPAPEAYSLDEIKKMIERETIVTVKDDPDKPGKQVIVSAQIKYTLLCNVQYHYGRNLSELPYSKPWKLEYHERVYDGFYDSIKFNELKDIYLFHTPLQGSDGTWRNDDQITLNDTSSKEGIRNFFIVPQLYDLNMGTACNVKISPEEAWQVYYLSNNPDFSVKNKYLLGGKREIPVYNMDNISINTKPNQLTEKLEAENRLYDITIRVTSPKNEKELIKLTLEGR